MTEGLDRQEQICRGNNDPADELHSKGGAKFEGAIVHLPAPSNLPNRLERQLQTNLDRARSSRADLWTAGRDVGGGASATELRAIREIIAYAISV